MKESKAISHPWRRPLLYRNQSIELQSKSMDRFLSDRDLRHERVEGCNPFLYPSAYNPGMEKKPNTFKSKILPMLKKWFRMSWLPEEKEKGWKRKSKTEIKRVKKTEIKKERNRFEKNSHQNVCMESVNVIWNKCVFLSLRNWDQIWLVAIFILQKLKSSIFLLVLKVKWVTSLKF